MNLHLRRYQTGPKGTLGRLMVDGQFDSHTLEDEVQTPKVPGETAIPAGKYRVSITWSPRFQRNLPYLHHVPGFEGVRIHAGNTEEDTHGCILVGLSVDPAVPAVYNSKIAFDRLFARLLEADRIGEEIWIELVDDFEEQRA